MKKQLTTEQRFAQEQLIELQLGGIEKAKGVFLKGSSSLVQMKDNENHFFLYVIDYIEDATFKCDMPITRAELEDIYVVIGEFLEKDKRKLDKTK